MIGAKKDAERALKDIREAVLRGTFRVPEKVEAPAGGVLTFAGLVAEHAESCAAQGVASHTLAIYRAAAARVAASPVGAVPVDRITVDTVEGFLRWRRNPEKGKAPAPGTIALDLNILSAALRRLVDKGILSRNPAKGVRRDKSPADPRQPLNQVEVDRLLQAADDGVRPLILAGLLTGARLSELAALTWGEVDSVAGTITIRRRKNRTAAVLTLHPRLAAELARHKARRGKKSGIPGPDDLVFLNGNGGQLVGPGKAWKRALRDAGLAGRRGICFHSLRHTYATNYLETGGNIRDLQRSLGHSSVDITEKYAHTNDARHREAILRLGAGARMEATGAEMRSACDPAPEPDPTTQGPPSQFRTGTWDATGVPAKAPGDGHGVLARPPGDP